MGAKFGEMSTLTNCTHQSFSMRGKSGIRPYHDLVANIAAEEMGHIELVANTVALLLDQTEASVDGAVPPLNFSGTTGNLLPEGGHRGLRRDRPAAVRR